MIKPNPPPWMKGDHCPHRMRRGCWSLHASERTIDSFLSAPVSLSQSTSERILSCTIPAIWEAARAKWKAIIVITSILFPRRDLPKRRAWMEPSVTGDDTRTLSPRGTTTPKPITSVAGALRSHTRRQCREFLAARRWEHELARKTLQEDKWAWAAAGRLLFPFWKLPLSSRLPPGVGVLHLS